MHVSAFQRWFSCLAAIAVLLVLLAPLISRGMHHAAPAPPASGDPSAAVAMDHSMHDMHHGHASMAHAPADPAHVLPADPHADHQMGVECDYCLIAARMLAFCVALLLVLLAFAAGSPAARHNVIPFAAAPFSRLGARGPPLQA